jgi:hypothetical protein
VEKGLDKGVVEAIKLFVKVREKQFFSSCTLIYNVIKWNKLDGDFNDHANKMIRRESYCLMERNSGFTRSHYMLPLGKYLHRIAPAAAMVIIVGVRKTQHTTNILPSNYCTFHKLIARSL